MLDNEGMLIINRDGVQSLETRLLDPQQASQCRDEMKRMLEIKEALSWRADMGGCCAGGAMSANLFGEVRLLEAAIQALDEGDCARAASLTGEFLRLAQGNGSL